jgi:hypothetical protein
MKIYNHYIIVTLIIGKKVYKIDIWLSDENSYEMMKFFYTGPKYFQILIATEFKKRGMKINNKYIL